MSASPKVSVLVPIFRVEKYLRQCIESLIQQTLQEIEIILIDDGSDDSCPQICDEYAARDSRVRVIHKENSGYGASMNLGLKQVRGEFIGIVESDDWVEPNMFEELYIIASTQQLDVVRSNFYQYTNAKEDRLISILPECAFNKIINPRKREEIFYCPPAIWSAIYRKSFLEGAHIDFSETPGASFQDFGYYFKVYLMVKRVWITDKAYYHYRCDRMGSSVKSQCKIFCVVDEWREIEHYLDQYPEVKKNSLLLRNRIKFNTYKWNLNRLCGQAQRDFSEHFRSEFKEILEKGGLRQESFDPDNWKYLINIISGSDPEYRLQRIRRKIARLFVKSKVRNGKVTVSVLWGLIRHEWDLPHLFLSTGEEENEK